jgi:thiamine-phosphate pyrophosphorylase
MLVTDRRLGDPVELVGRALAGVPAGTALVQLREKDLEGRALFELAAALREVTRRAGARLLVNDRLDVALACGADGVHLPEDGLPVGEARALVPRELLVGASAHDAGAAGAKARAGADLVTIGPIWDTPSKAAYGPSLGVAAIARAAAAVDGRAALFAIGGVETAARADEARRAGAHGVAAIRAVFAASDPAAAARSLLGAAA